MPVFFPRINPKDDTTMIIRFGLIEANVNLVVPILKLLLSPVAPFAITPIIPSLVKIYEKAPLIGPEALAHRSGIHQDGAIKTKDMNFVDGKWEKTFRVVEIETGKVEILKIVLNEDMTIDRILFRMFGDVTGDGKVGALDARWILQHVALTKDFDESQKLVADINGDGKLGAIDARGVLQFVAGTKKF